MLILARLAGQPGSWKCVPGRPELEKSKRKQKWRVRLARLAGQPGSWKMCPGRPELKKSKRTNNGGYVWQGWAGSQGSGNVPLIDLCQKIASNAMNRGHLEHFLRRPAKSEARGKPEEGLAMLAGQRAAAFYICAVWRGYT